MQLHLAGDLSINGILARHKLVSWSIYNVSFQHKYGYIRDERSVKENYPYPVKDDQLYINLSSHPKRESKVIERLI